MHYEDRSAVSVPPVSLRVELKSPSGDVAVRDVVDGRWEEAGATDADTVVGGGSWALPGLVDAHSHIASDQLFAAGDFESALRRAGEALRAGVTLLLDKGWTDDIAIRVTDALAPGERPEIEAAEVVLASVGGYYPGFGREIDPVDIASEVSTVARAGRGWVKLIGDWPRRGVGPTANFSESELASAVRVAEETGSKVAIHTMAPDVPSMAVAAGVHSIEHGLFLTADDVDQLGRREGMWVPTVLRCEETRRQLGPDSTGGRLFTEGLARMKGLLTIAVEAGVHVLAGTDLVGSPANVAAEALRLAEYGLSNAAVIAAVSTSGHEATGRDARFTPGTPANAVLFPANPLEDLGVLSHPEAVLRLGRLV